MSQLLQLKAPHFCAGLIVTDDRVSGAAPILRYMMRWSVARVRAYAIKKGWTLVEGIAVT